MTVKRPYALSVDGEACSLTRGAEKLSDMAEKARKGLPEKQGRIVREAMRELKERKYKTTAELGRALGITRSATSQILRQQTGPSWETAAALATILKVSPSALLAGEATAAVASALLDGGDGESPPRRSGEGATEHMAEMLRLRDLPNARYPRLEYALLFYSHDAARWSPYVVDMARRGQFEAQGCSGWTSPQWADALDRLERIVQSKLDVPPPPIEPAGIKRKRP